MKFWKKLIDSLLGANEPKPTIVEQMRAILDSEKEAEAPKAKPKAKAKAAPVAKKPAVTKKAKK